MTNTAHDIEAVIEKSSVIGNSEVPTSLLRAVFARIANHSHFKAALSHIHCSAVSMLETPAFFDGSQWDESTKISIRDALVDVDSVLLISFMTSDTEPKPFGGGGVTYDFVIHPKTLDIVHTQLGSWRT